MPLCGIAIGLVMLSPAPGAARDPLRVAQAQPGGPGEEPSPRPPDSDIEEIVVIGEETESAADFGSADSVTGFGAEDLAALGAQDIADLAGFTPNLEIVTGGATTPTFFIRGVGLNDFNPTAAGAVAIYQDDVAINAPALQLGSLFDVEAVNILRGPQGTGMGRNASAGAIKIYSRKPSGDFGGFLRTDFGNYNYQDYEGAFEAPIYQDLLAGRFAFRLTKRDGTMKNNCGNAPPFSTRVPYPGTGVGNPVDPPWSICGEPVPTEGAVSSIPVGLEEDLNDRDNWATRGTLLFQPTLDMTWLVNAHGSRRDELSRLGQSIGTGGNFCIDGPICSAPFFGVPPELLGVASSGWLGGTVGGTSFGSNYSPREIRQRLNELAPCILSRDEPCASQPLEVRVAANNAKIKLSEELASELDPEPWEGDFNHTGPTTNDTYGGYVKSDILLPAGLQLTTTSGYDTYDRLIDIDLDFSPETLFHITTEDDAWQYYQDVQLEGALGETAGLRWQAGGYFLREVLNAEVNNNFGELQAAGVARRDYTQRIWSAAGFGYFSYDFWDDFTLDGGVRYNWSQKDIEMFIEPSVEDPRTEKLEDIWQAPTGTIRLTYRFREDTQAFWKYTRGWKPGSYNATASQFTGVTVAEPEELDAFETGLRGSWFLGNLTLDGSLFYYSYSDYQIFTAKQFLGGNPEFVILNASDAEVYGAEVDATARPWGGAFLNLRFSWLESQFLDFVQTDQFLARRGGQDLVNFRDRQNSGNSLLNSPRFKVSILAEQEFRLGRYGSVVVRYDGVWTDTTFYDPSEGRGLGNLDGDQFLPDNTIGQEPYWLHNLRLAWRSPNGDIEVAGWVRNLEDKAYKTFAFDGSTFRTTTLYFVGDPRTYGVSASVYF